MGGPVEGIFNRLESWDQLIPLLINHLGRDPTRPGVAVKTVSGLDLMTTTAGLQRHGTATWICDVRGFFTAPLHCSGML